MSKLEKTFIVIIILFTLLWFVSVYYAVSWLFSDNSAKVVHHWLQTASGGTGQ